MIGPLYFFVRNWGGRHVVHPFKKKIQMTLRLICPDLVAGKSGLKLFLPKNLFFNPFVYPKHHMNRDKSIYGLKIN